MSSDWGFMLHKLSCAVCRRLHSSFQTGALINHYRLEWPSNHKNSGSVFATKHLNNRIFFILNHNRCFQGFCVSRKYKLAVFNEVWQPCDGDFIRGRTKQLHSIWYFAHGATPNATMCTVLQPPSHSRKYQMHRKRQKKTNPICYAHANIFSPVLYFLL